MAMVDLEPSEWREEEAEAETHGEPGEMYEVTPEYVNLLTAPTESYLCDLEHNIYNLQFVDFRIRSLDEGNEGITASIGTNLRKHRCYDFTMPFVIPNTRNTWEMIYTKPELSDEWKEALISSPWEVRSDSFYFVDRRLVMHNRAEYNYGY
ncbi:unc119b [Symbiodinium necroappetens]|uniref:Unc119b protein n=1 Tax=Symbiodinium necroappetens TaxID=1628268 RepID=A0A812SGM7_9DINO|nr:unc119b [Symbiodinium necroappetens]